MAGAVIAPLVAPLVALALAGQQAAGDARLDIVSRSALAGTLTREAEAGDGRAMLGLAELMAAEAGDPQALIDLLRRAGESGQPCALLRAARIARDIRPDPVAVQMDMDRAITLGCVEARYELALWLLQQNRDGARAQALLAAAAASGDERALIYLARALLAGRGIAEADDAAALYRRAAIAGSAPAQGALARLLMARHAQTGKAALVREAWYWSLIVAARGGEAAGAQARSIGQAARHMLSASQLRQVGIAATRYRPGTFTLPARGE
jgi:hypothetical protein